MHQSIFRKYHYLLLTNQFWIRYTVCESGTLWIWVVIRLLGCPLIQWKSRPDAIKKASKQYKMATVFKEKQGIKVMLTPESLKP